MTALVVAAAALLVVLLVGLCALRAAGLADQRTEGWEK